MGWWKPKSKLKIKCAIQPEEKRVNGVEVVDKYTSEENKRDGNGQVKPLKGSNRSARKNQMPMAPEKFKVACKAQIWKITLAMHPFKMPTSKVNPDARDH